MPSTVYGKSVNVLHYHHQSVRKLGTGLYVTLRDPDGTIEGIEHKTLPVYGVQWHPELMGSSGGKILRQFLRVCEKGSK